ncbi:OmpA/MotB family protein [Lachnobacterium bovis]|uniref:OmpA/MotB family protein n=1 Tax=Lachnobacterium bovis TaxID=140626 RepID=UPI00048C7D64|nr:OmpA family protein [Lachnobacterium bovis]
MLNQKQVAILDKISQILGLYTQNTIDIEGHTDNVPISSAKYPNNNVLSMYRALSVMDLCFYQGQVLNPANVKILWKRRNSTSCG